MTSFGCNEVSLAGFNPSFRIQGQVYHLIGSIVLSEGESSKFAQIHFIDDRESEMTGKSKPMGGMYMLLCGDFRQILPVIQGGGTRGSIVDSCLKSLSCGTM